MLLREFYRLRRAKKSSRGSVTEMWNEIKPERQRQVGKPEEEGNLSLAVQRGEGGKKLKEWGFGTIVHLCELE